MVTMQNVADRAGVTRKTVYNVINYPEKVSPEVTIRVKKALEDLDYKVSYLAQSLSTGKTNIVGLVLPDTKNPSYSEILSDFEIVARENGYNTIICDTQYSSELEDYYFDMLYKRCVDGVIYYPFVLDNPNHDYSKNILKIHNYGVPSVLFNYTKTIEDISCFYSDTYAATIKAVKYLYDKGAKKIAYFYFTYNDLDVGSISRHAGYMKGVQDLGIECLDYCISSPVADFKRDLLQEILDSERFDAAIAVTDVMAAEVLNKIDNEYKLPIIGFDNSELARLYNPGITSIAPPTSQITRDCFMYLLKEMQGEKQDTVQKVYDSKMFIRKSTE